MATIDVAWKDVMSVGAGGVTPASVLWSSTQPETPVELPVPGAVKRAAAAVVSRVKVGPDIAPASEMLMLSTNGK